MYNVTSDLLSCTPLLVALQIHIVAVIPCRLEVPRAKADGLPA
jgi:hypothetical protein